MARRRSEETRAFWRMVIQLQGESSLPIREFCAQEDSQKSFFAWRKLRQEPASAESHRALEKKNSEDSPRLVPVRLLEAKAAAAEGMVATFLELAPPVSAASCECVVELENAGGTKLRMWLKGIEAPDVATPGRSLWSCQP